MAVPDGTTLAIDGFLALATAMIYARVTQLIATRAISHPTAKMANGLFALWWAAVGMLTLATGAQSILGSLAVERLEIYTLLTFITVALLVAALFGLLSYLLYIYTGRPAVFVWLGVAHLALLVFYLGLVAWRSPIDIALEPWRVQLVYAREPTPLIQGVASALVFIPTVAAAALYGTLAFGRERDATMRYRVAVVSGAFVFWFGTAGLGAVFGWNANTYWPVVSRGLSLTATCLVVLAYLPPPYVRKRWQIESVAATSSADLAANPPSSLTTEPYRKAGRMLFPQRGAKQTTWWLATDAERRKR